MTEHMGMVFLQPVFLGKAVQKSTNRIRIDTAAVSPLCIKHSILLVIPLAAVTFRLFYITIIIALLRFKVKMQIEGLLARFI